jgi:hypothetical protein
MSPQRLLHRVRILRKLRHVGRAAQEEQKVRLDDIENIFVPLNYRSFLHGLRELCHLGKRF